MTEWTMTSLPSWSSPAASQPRIIGSRSSGRPTPRSDHRSWGFNDAALTVTVVQPSCCSGSGRSPIRRPLRGAARSWAAANTASMARIMPEEPRRARRGCHNRRGMARVTASATKGVDAPPERGLEFLRAYREGRPRILTDNYTAYRVEQGGQGQGTLIGYHFAAGGRERDYRLAVEEDGGGLSERDQLSSFESRWTVVPEGAGAQVTLESS